MGRRDRHIATRIAALGAVVLALWAVTDLVTPRTVAWEDTLLSGLRVERAEGLVIQDRMGDVTWATMGFSIYRSVGDAPFERVHTLFPSPSEAWAGYSATFRRSFRYQELVELMAVSDHELVAFAGGEVFRVDLATGTDERVHRLRYYGRGVGRGLMPHGLTRDDTGAIYYGEYPTGRLGPGSTVRIYRSADEGRSWQVAHEFPARFVRHVHAVQWDPYGQALWVATGDRDSESRVGYSTDGGRTFRWIGSGSQRFRAVSLLFQPERVAWAMDAPRVDSRIVTWHRATGRIELSEDVLASPGYYARTIDAFRGVVTLAEREATVLLVEGAQSRTLFHWAVQPDPSRPHPSVRLMRSSTPADPDAMILNPLRTETEGAAVYRVGLASATGQVTVAGLGGR